MSTAMDQRPQQHSRAKSTFSLKSDKSSKKESKHERHLSDDKNKPHFAPQSKADPNAAIAEVQPVAAALEKPTLQSLRSFQHTDSHGNPIAEPDLSNPTRSRWERPLDTIRSFEAAIDSEYRRRSQSMRVDNQSEVMSGFASRRSSYYGGGYEQNRYSQANGFYGSRQAAGAREGWGENGYGPNGGRGSRFNRMQSDPAWNRGSNGTGVYPTQGYQQSHDTGITGGSNGSQSDPYSTDPSSENSSIERGGPVQRPDLGEQYGFTGFGAGPRPMLEDYGNRAGPSGNGYFGQQYNNGMIAPPVPAKASPPPPANNPNVIQLSMTDSRGQGLPPVDGNRPNVLARKSTDASDKRKSWFRRRFSKN